MVPLAGEVDVVAGKIDVVDLAVLNTRRCCRNFPAIVTAGLCRTLLILKGHGALPSSENKEGMSASKPIKFVEKRVNLALPWPGSHTP